MFKRLFFLITVLLICSTAFAGSPTSKLARGLSNLAWFPYEYANAFESGKQEGGFFTGLSRSLLLGTGASIKRILSGAYDVVTFPIAVPENYAPIAESTEVSAKDTFEEIFARNRLKTFQEI